MISLKENFTEEFKKIYYKHLNHKYVKSTPQVIEEIMQEKSKQLLEAIEVEDYLINEINENRKNTFTEVNNKGGKSKNNGNLEGHLAEYNKYFIELPNINPSNTNLNFKEKNKVNKKIDYSNILNDSSFDKSKILNDLKANDKLNRCNNYYYLFDLKIKKFSYITYIIKYIRTINFVFKICSILIFDYIIIISMI